MPARMPASSISIGTPFSRTATRVLFCGGGELGKEVVIELKRFGIEVIVVDRYDHSPAMQVADRSHVIDMLDPAALRRVVEYERPDAIVPEIEAIATAELLALERDGYTVIPSARAVHLTMNREGIRRLAAEELGLPTSPYRFADSREAFDRALADIGWPCVVKPIMSSSGKGQSVVSRAEDVDRAWRYAQEGGRAGGGKVIVEGFIRFDYEITQLTVRHAGGVSFLDPVGHIQVHGDYHHSWQPQAMSEAAIARARDIAERITGALGGLGIFGVELFVRGEDVIFSEVSPRPHDTGMVTMISQDLSQFALHARAILGLPIPNIRTHGPSASSVVLADGQSDHVRVGLLDRALAEPDTQIRIFGKPGVRGHRRMGVALARGRTVEEALDKAKRAAGAVTVTLE
jgi:phosphoribosylglycinamide formyltransferase 2